MSNFRADILEAVGSREILAIKLTGYFDDWREGSSGDPRDAPIKAFVGKCVPRSAVEAFLNVEYDDGFGGQDCPNFCLWTEDRVFFIHEYDGSTSVVSVQRNPDPAP